MSLSNACITFATARFDTCTRLANFSSNSSLSHVDNCTKNEVVASLSSKKNYLFKYINLLSFSNKNYYVVRKKLLLLSNSSAVSASNLCNSTRISSFN